MNKMQRLDIGFFLLYIVFSVAACKKSGDEPATPVKSNLQKYATVERNPGTDTLTLSFSKQGTWEIYIGTTVDNIDMNAAVGTTSAESVQITGLSPEQRYYFELVFNGTEKAMVSETRLALSGEDNYRDLGGIVTKNGKSVKWGFLFRSGDLSKLTDSDKNYISSTGTVNLIDFRDETEKVKAPDKVPSGITTIALPIYDQSFSESQATYWLITQDSVALDTMLIHANRLFVTDFQTEYSDFLKLLESGDKTVFHCSAGKDRAGFASALLLSALGIEREVIIDNYLESNQYLAQSNEQTINLVNGYGMNGELLRPVLEVRREYIETAFDVIDNQYGGIDNYLNLLGANAQKLQQLYLE
jgi:protein-tyrosine phosphatase